MVRDRHGVQKPPEAGHEHSQCYTRLAERLKSLHSMKTAKYDFFCKEYGAGSV